MFPKWTLSYLWLLRLVLCDKSFTIVLDTTWSMQQEIDIIKVNLASAINSFNNTDIANYIIVPFNYPDVKEPVVVSTSRDFINSINGITARGGHQSCPENSLAGIEKALQISKQESYIFVFTDAYSKDASKFNSVLNLCQSTRSQVVIFLTGYCLPSDLSPNVQVYYDIAKSCSGAVARFDPNTLREAFKYIKEIINEQWTEIITYDTFDTYKQITFSVNSFTKAMLLVVSGEYPELEISTPDASRRSIEKILDSRHTQVIRLSEPSIGEYMATIRCRNQTSVTLYKRNELPIRFGFSSKQPRSMRETSKRPLPGRTNYILVDVLESKIRLETLEIQVSGQKQVLAFEEYLHTGLYLAQTFIDPDKPFRILIKGYDTATFQVIQGAIDNLVPQQTSSALDTTWRKPESEIIDGSSITVDYGKNATVACLVTGYPSPNISWEDDNGVILPSEDVILEIPLLYISYLHIVNPMGNSTIYCTSKNSMGEDSQSINVYIYRPYTFDVIQTPTDQTIEYGSEGRLYCEVSAYPEATITWYHNDSVVESDDVQTVLELNALWIKNMTVDHFGEYKCQMSNEANTQTYSAFVNISGIEAPQVEVETPITLKLGDWSNLECRIIKGKPSPVITWTYKPEDGYEFSLLPDGIVADGGQLKIASAQADHKGVYRCDAANAQGQHSADITVQVQYPPSITNGDISTMTVKEEDEVTLPCVVNASPAARVHWEMSQDDVIIALDERHHTDKRHTHRFKALLNDSGNYHCIAENDIGRTEKTITLNVLVPPYIEALKSKMVVLRAGSSIVLPCNVIYGNPTPSTKWEFIARDSTKQILSRNNSSSQLHLTNISHANEGSYLCIAENNVGTDSIQISVKIQ